MQIHVNGKNDLIAGFGANKKQAPTIHTHVIDQINKDIQNPNVSSIHFVANLHKHKM